MMTPGGCSWDLPDESGVRDRCSHKTPGTRRITIHPRCYDSRAGVADWRLVAGCLILVCTRVLLRPPYAGAPSLRGFLALSASLEKRPLFTTPPTKIDGCN